VTGASDLLLGRTHHVLRLEAKPALEVLQRSRGPERAHPDDGAAATGVPLPAEGGRGLHGDARGDRLLVLALVLILVFVLDLV
jgi:hypothetical protein